VEYFLILDGDVIAELICHDDELEAINDEPLTSTLALAVISPIPSFKRLRDSNLITYKLIGDRLGSMEVVDVEDVVCLVGRVRDQRDWYVVDRTTVVGKVNFVDSVISN
jgi:hypothetical protein